MKKVLSIILSLIIIVLSLSCVAIAAVTLPGDVNDDGIVAATDARMILQVVAGLKEKSFIKNFDNADVIVDGELRATDARKILQIVAGLNNEPSETPTYPQEADTAGWAKLFNQETAKLSKGTYKWSRTCDEVEKIKVTGVFGLGASVESAVADFLGIGSLNGTNKDAGKYGLIAMNLTADDIAAVRMANGSVTIVIKNTLNPSNDGKTSFSHVSNDFVTIDEVNKMITEIDKKGSVTNFQATYYDIEVTGKINSAGKIANITIAYKLKADLSAEALGFKPVGEGTVKTVITYEF